MMSSETASDLGVVEIHSYVRGYHIYNMDIWDAQIGQELLLKREPDNSEDSHAVAEDLIVGNVPYNLAPVVEMFLRRVLK